VRRVETGPAVTGDARVIAVPGRRVGVLSMIGTTARTSSSALTIATSQAPVPRAARGTSRRGEWIPLRRLRRRRLEHTEQEDGADHAFIVERARGLVAVAAGPARRRRARCFCTGAPGDEPVLSRYMHRDSRFVDLALAEGLHAGELLRHGAPQLLEPGGDRRLRRRAV
jgi:hypothetical protein